MSESTLLLPPTEAGRESLPAGIEDFGLAIDAAVDRFRGAVVRLPDDDDLGRGSGGQQLVLYPNPDRPTERIIITAIAPDPEARDLAPGNPMQIVYRGKRAAGAGRYELYGHPGHRRVTDWNRFYDNERRDNGPVSQADDDYSGIVAAIGRATPDKPERPRRAQDTIRRTIGRIAAGWNR